jgi:hypothetical protein
MKREEKERDSSSESGKRYFMYGLVDKIYLRELITIFSLQSQDFVDILIVMNTKRVDRVEKESLNTE